MWVPKQGGEEVHVAEATRVVTDARARHYWDEGGALMAAYTRVLGLNQDAWDIYLVYPPGVRWEGDLPPAPAFWMHQLRARDGVALPGPRLDDTVLAQRTLQTLGAR